MFFKFAVLPLAFFAMALSGFATQTESIAINTSSLPANTQSFLDFLYNGGPGSPSASVGVSGFSSTGTLDATNISRTNSTGQLPAGVTLTNNNAEYLEAFTFGSNIGFQLAFSEPAYGSIFTFSLLNQTLDGSYLTSNVNDGYLFTLAIDNQGRIVPTTYPTETGAPSVVTITPFATATPEAASLTLSGIAFGLFALLRLSVRGIRGERGVRGLCPVWRDIPL